MKKIGITGQEGFLGSHIANNLKLLPEEYQLVYYDISFFKNKDLLDQFVSSCDVIYHLAAMNRHDDQQVIFDTNIALVESLIASLERTNSAPHVLFSSSSQELQDNLYGKSKLIGRELLEKWAKENKASFTGFVIPNVYGPFGKPFYNSFVATFCHLLTHNDSPKVLNDSEVSLIYVQNLVVAMLEPIKNIEIGINRIAVPEDGTYKVSEVLVLLNRFKKDYFDQGIMSSLKDGFELNMFNTFRSYIDHKNHFPVLYAQHTDDRGAFVEIIRLEQQGQVSFSTTVPEVTRGNHYHTRKIERFSVIKGKALIELRKIGTDEVLSFHLDGKQPSYVDMPIWYTHNIKNIGGEELYTMFWINEFYDPKDADTHFETV
ncbi:SDR family oxidoreductase [Nonlabens sp. Ci31]|jgi:UDP-2-acetamido-2,6-beta-L-arabino-hexul-4-ose reductase|uniref:polysaccharide biosynthesis C-terminal domain-containing protein n=1 Tax=Nonlabens sp. Ci31 TaxID=2608253 RepID=UPI001462A863|nr:NAD-dependent epimerase/dehydratase family protein [Nonlabens sp. Ci31]QJP34920.1 SDR family oxidoreductase [Nonlabens sp. Ci31]